MILALGLRAARSVLPHSRRRLSPTRGSPDDLFALSRIGVSGDVPIARRLMMRGDSEQRFERDVTIKAAIVAEDEFFEIGVHMLAAQAVIRAETPAFHQRENPMNPRQHHMSRHLADDARIVPIVAGEPGKG